MRVVLVLILLLFLFIGGIVLTDKNFSTQDLFDNKYYMSRYWQFFIPPYEQGPLKDAIVSQLRLLGGNEDLKDSDVVVYYDNYINKIESLYVSGFLRIKNQVGTIKFISVKQQNWIVPWIGNAPPACVDIAQYRFPPPMAGCIEDQ